MTTQEIKAAVEAGKKVYWEQENYEVVKDTYGQFMIKCTTNGRCIDLMWTDAVTMNGKPEDFYTPNN